MDEWKRDKLVEFAKTNTEWRISRDESKNKDYYYNKLTRKSQWTLPLELIEYDEKLVSEYRAINGLVNVEIVDKSSLTRQLSKEGDTVSVVGVELDIASASDIQERKRQKLDSHAVPLEDVRSDTTFEPSASSTDMTEKVTDIHVSKLSDEEMDAECKRLQGILTQKDSILEPGVIGNIKSLIQTHKQPPGQIVKSLVESYTGYAPMSRIVLELINYANAIKTPQSVQANRDSLAKSESDATLLDSIDNDTVRSDSSSNDSPESLTAKDEKVIADILIKQIKQRFNRKVADEFVLQFKGTPPWLLDMIQDDDFRVLLEDLYKGNSSSAFLILCMKEIAAMKADGRIPATEAKSTATSDQSENR